MFSSIEKVCKQMDDKQGITDCLSIEFKKKGEHLCNAQLNINKKRSYFITKAFRLLSWRGTRFYK